MHAWQRFLQFFDAHPWFLPSVAAIFTLLGAAYKIAAWARRMIRSIWEGYEDDLIAGYLARQINPGPFESDKRGLSPPAQKDCSSMDIAEVLRKKPVKAHAILERLESQQRVKRHGTDSWSATDYQTRQPIGRFVRIWLYYLCRPLRKISSQRQR